MGLLTAYFVDCLMGWMEARIFNAAQHMKEHSRSLLLDRDKSESGLIDGYDDELLFGGYPLKKWNLEALHEKICYMKQSTNIYEDSLLFNVTL